MERKDKTKQSKAELNFENGIFTYCGFAFFLQNILSIFVFHCFPFVLCSIFFPSHHQSPLTRTHTCDRRNKNNLSPWICFFFLFYRTPFAYKFVKFNFYLVVVLLSFCFCFFFLFFSSLLIGILNNKKLTTSINLLLKRCENRWTKNQ